VFLVPAWPVFEYDELIAMRVPTTGARAALAESRVFSRLGEIEACRYAGRSPHGAASDYGGHAAMR
jgi:hypothetical protein